MTSSTPICDLIELLLSRGTSPGDTIAAARLVEAASARGSGSIEERREKWRLKKARQRKAKRGQNGGQSPVHIDSSGSSKIQTRLKKESKKDSHVPVSPGTPGDDWPADFAAQFWDRYPPGRRYDKKQVFALLARLRAEGFVNAEKKRERLTWATLMGGLDRYIATNPGEYAKAPLPWLRGHRWQGDYTNGGSNGKEHRHNGRPASGDAIALAAARRFGHGGRHGPAPGTASPVQPAAGMGHERQGARGGRADAVILDLKPGP